MEARQARVAGVGGIFTPGVRARAVQGSQGSCRGRTSTPALRSHSLSATYANSAGVAGVFYSFTHAPARVRAHARPWGENRRRTPATAATLARQQLLERRSGTEQLAAQRLHRSCRGSCATSAPLTSGWQASSARRAEVAEVFHSFTYAPARARTRARGQRVDPRPLQPMQPLHSESAPVARRREARHGHDGTEGRRREGPNPPRNRGLWRARATLEARPYPKAGCGEEACCNASHLPGRLPQGPGRPLAQGGDQSALPGVRGLAAGRGDAVQFAGLPALRLPAIPGGSVMRSRLRAGHARRASARLAVERRRAGRSAIGSHRAGSAARPRRVLPADGAKRTAAGTVPRQVCFVRRGAYGRRDAPWPAPEAPAGRREIQPRQGRSCLTRWPA